MRHVMRRRRTRTVYIKSKLGNALERISHELHLLLQGLRPPW